MSNTIPLSREGRRNETHETLDLGTFEMVSSRMAVSDPCYDADVWCRGELENVLPGTWQAYAIKRDKGEWGPRVVRLVAVHREYADTCEFAAELAPFEVGVDSGQAGLIDCLHYDDAGKLFWNDVRRFNGYVFFCGNSKEILIAG